MPTPTESRKRAARRTPAPLNLQTSLSEADAAPLLIDGAMGTQLEAAGLVPGGQRCLTDPDIVRNVHRSYVDAGAQLIITNTLTMNPLYIAVHDLGVDVRAVNQAGARLAREAAGPNRVVLGDLSSTGQILEPYGDCTEQQLEDSFAEQARALAEGGVDAFLVETVFDLREALSALRGCRRAAQLPVLVCMTFQTAERGGRTMMGNSAADCARALDEAGAAAIGANCGEIDPAQMATIIAAMRGSTAKPLIAQPNAGKPRVENNRVTFGMDPQQFAETTLACRRAGASILGGCCGTSPAHIRALAAALKRAG